MRTGAVIIGAAVLGALALGWSLRAHRSPQLSQPVTAVEQSEHLNEEGTTPESAPPNTARQAPAAAESSSVIDSNSPIDAATRARFNQQAREFFAHAKDLSAEDRAREAGQLAAELSRLERAGGLSAGETFLVRAGLIRETVADSSEQAAQIKALKERYETDARTRMAAASVRSDPAFESYKVREKEIVTEVMSMETIPDGLTRDEYLRRRLQSARERLTP
jgi:hypothetical protein